MWQDFRYAFRVLMKSPALTTIAVAALALGIGANTVCFTTVNVILLRPLPFHDLGSLVQVWQTYPQRGYSHDMVSPPDFLDWRGRTRSFAHLSALTAWDANLTGVDEAERLQGFAVSHDFFPALGMPPLAGRTFSAAEEQPGKDQVVVISHGLWQRRFACDPHIAGKKISLNGLGYAVVGVMPLDFDFPLATDVWKPLAFSPAERDSRDSRYLAVLGRLKDSASVDQASAEMSSLTQALAAQYPRTNAGRGVRIQTIRSSINNVTDRFTLVLMAAAGFVLLLACSNVANIQLARTLTRQKEMALRMALGAGRRQIVRQMLAESLLIALAGGLLGLLLAAWDADASAKYIPPEVLRWVAGMKYMRVDRTVLAFNAAISMLTGILCGIAPALHAARQVNLVEALKSGGKIAVGGERHTVRRALVVAEVALALLLLVAAGLMVNTFRGIAVFDVGYDTRNLVTMNTSLPGARYATPAAARIYFDEAVERLSRIPGVKAAGGSAAAPLGDFRVEGQPPREAREPVPDLRLVAGDYFRAMGMPILYGRPIASADSGAAPQHVAVISESVARRYWKTPKLALGARILPAGANLPPLTVVGVTGDLKDWFRHAPWSTIYIPNALMPQAHLSLAIRTHGAPESVMLAAQRELHDLDRNQPLYDVTTGEQYMDAQTSGVRISAVMMAVFAGIALVLAVTGIYGIVSYTVAQRTHEIGVRLALGASPAGVLRLVVAQVLRVTLTGLLIGLAAALILTRVMASALYGVVSLDPSTFAAFALVLAFAAAAAAWFPARRATRIDPIQALHYE
jgi:putative ABC transport system permease protein